jgi:hypothetical protein
MLKLRMGWAESSPGKTTMFNRSAIRSAVFIQQGLRSDHARRMEKKLL